MPVAVAFIGSVIGGAVATVGGIVATVAGAVAAGVATVVSAVGGIVSSVTSSLSAGLTSVTSTLQAVTGKIVYTVGTAIAQLESLITVPLQPILHPIKVALSAIYEYLSGVAEWVNVALKPYKDLITVIDTITALTAIKNLNEGIAEVGNLLGQVAAGRSQSTAAAIAQLLAMITKTSVGILDSVHQTYQALSDRIENFSDTIQRNFEKRMTEMEATIYQTIAGIEDSLSGRSITVQRQVTAIERRISDLPWFMSMLIRALS